MNVFVRDNAWQREVRDRILAPSFYGEYSMNGRYVFLDKGKLATTLQKRFAVDTIMQKKSGETVCIEEKIVRWPKNKDGGLRDKAYAAFTLETRSCTIPGRETPGWMAYAEADYLLYCFSSRSDTYLTCYLLDFPALKEWFWPRADNYPKTVTEQINRTECRVVPIADVTADVRHWKRCLE